MEELNQEPRQKQYPDSRSFASSNWRSKDAVPPTSSQQYRKQNDSPINGGRGFDRTTQRSGNHNNDRGERQSQTPSTPGEITTPRLYVGNLPYTAQSADIESFFKDNGFQVVNLSMSIDPMTGRNPSYCFVDLTSIDEAKRAMGLNGIDVLGRPVKLNSVAKRDDGAKGLRVNRQPNGGFDAGKSGSFA